MTRRTDPTDRIGVPPPQHNLQTARDMAVSALADQTDEQLQWLGAERTDAGWRLQILNDSVTVDLATGDTRCEDGTEAPPALQVIVLHYLNVRVRPEKRPPEITFATLPSARTYAKVHEGRVNGRLCRKIGPDRQSVLRAAAGIGAREVDGGDAAFEAEMFPHISVRVIWYAADEELPPSATILMPANIESYLCVEDIVVMSEVLVGRLTS
ncbi:MAG: DUF3786 domain-containing protein [Planctomycetota bacterium]|jgi:hypothetical protein